MEKEKKKDKDENVSPALIPTSKVSMMCKKKKRKEKQQKLIAKRRKGKKGNVILAHNQNCMEPTKKD